MRLPAASCATLTAPVCCVVHTGAWGSGHHEFVNRGRSSVAGSKTTVGTGGGSAGGRRGRVADGSADKAAGGAARRAGSNGAGSERSARRLVIVESPAKARKIASY